MKKKDDTSPHFIVGLLEVTFITIALVMLLPFSVVRRPLVKRFDLEERSMNWKISRWILLPLKWCALPGFVYCAWQTLLIYQSAGSFNLEAIHHAAPYLGSALICAFFFSLVQWIQNLYHSAAIQKRIAGVQAERFVQKLIDKNLERYPGSQALHGALFVFNRGLSNEFSVEADHLLITQHAVYLIETKYRSGTIAAHADSSHWKVSSLQGEARMRNALKQAKNCAGVLKRECKLPCNIIPLVAIRGKEVKITDAPANVVPTEELFKVINAFEFSSQSEGINPLSIIATLTQYTFTDKQSIANHIARANVAKSRSDMRDIVATSSVD